MTLDAAAHLAAVTRSASALAHDGRPARKVVLGRTFPAAPDDLWDAVTNPDRIPRWFLPVTGELALGGRFQLEGNAGGVITACEPPSHFAATWEFAGDTSWLDVRCTPVEENTTRIELAHTSLHSPHWDRYGPGAAGVGWELGLLGLALHLARPDAPGLDENAFAASPEGRAIITGSSEAWGEAGASADMSADAASAAVRRTTAFYTGEPG